jgi:iron complex outermembrane receptor protein
MTKVKFGGLRPFLFGSSISIVAAMMVAAPAVAQEAEDGEKTEQGSDEVANIVVIGQRAGVLQLDQEADTASRLGLTAMETPASVDVITKDMIRSLGDRTVVSAAARAPGIIDSSSAFGFALSSRGFTGNNSVMQLYDGMRVYTTTQTFPVDPFMAEKIEVLRGASSVLYGDGGIGGAMNVVRKQPNRDRSEGEARLSGGSFNTFGVAVGLTGPLNDTISLRADVSFNQSDGWMDRGDSSSLAISAAVRIQPTDNFSVTLTHDRADVDPTHWYGPPLRDGQLVPETIGKNYNIGNGRLEFDDEWTQLKVEWNPTDNLSITNVSYYMTAFKDWYDTSSYSWVDNQIRRATFLEILYYNEQIGNRFNAVHGHSLFGLEHTFSVGAEFNSAETNRTDSSPNTRFDFVDPYDVVPGLFLDGAFGTRYKFNSVVDQFAVFGESKLSFTDNLSLMTGLRHDRPKATRDDALDPAQSYSTTYPSTSWRAGLVYNPSDDIAIYGQYSTAADPITNITTATLANSTYELATGRQFEAGVKAQFFGGRGEFSLSAYKIVKNKILTRSDSDPTLSVQIGQQSSEGIEASFGLALTNQFSILANGTILNAQYDDFVELVGASPVSRNGNVPTGVAEMAGNLWLSWGPLEALRLDAGVRYVGERYSDAANTRLMPGYVVVDASARYNISENTSVAVNLRNVLDKLYAQQTYSNQWILGEPRSVAVTLEQRF